MRGESQWKKKKKTSSKGKGSHSIRKTCPLRPGNYFISKTHGCLSNIQRQINWPDNDTPLGRVFQINKPRIKIIPVCLRAIQRHWPMETVKLIERCTNELAIIEIGRIIIHFIHTSLS